MAQFLADPRVGLVGALHMPKEPYITWIHRMRAFELFYSFGFLRVAQSEVDTVPCIPGSFCAFRREAALAIGALNRASAARNIADNPWTVIRCIGTPPIEISASDQDPSFTREVTDEQPPWGSPVTPQFHRDPAA